MTSDGRDADTQRALDQVVREFVDRTTDVRGAVLGSADGHPLSASIDEVATDAATVAAMGAAMAGLAAQLARVATDAPVANSHVRAVGVQVWVLDVGRAATLTVFAAEHADASAVTSAVRTTIDSLVAVLTPPN